MQASPQKKTDTNAIVIGIVFLGLLVIFFAFGKSIIDLIIYPTRTIDLAADDQINAGFLPVYAEEDALADPSLVSVDGSPSSGFPTPQAGDAVPTPLPGEVPDRVVINTIGLDATVIPVEFEQLEFEGELYEQWLAPDYRAVGWHHTSVGLGVPGNTVLNGHHNIYGEVFRDLYQVKVGDQIQVFSNDQEFDYVVVYTAILPERNQPLDVRLANAEWIQPTEDERLTVITCWPYESNTHRVVLVAVPVRSTDS
jgi:LPXTG-site transpeptidase (sortase) family protein